MHTEPESAHPPIRNCSITPFWTTAPIDTCIVAMAEGRLNAPGCACVPPVAHLLVVCEDGELAIYSGNLQKMKVSGAIKSGNPTIFLYL